MDNNLTFSYKDRMKYYRLSEQVKNLSYEVQKLSGIIKELHSCQNSCKCNTCVHYSCIEPYNYTNTYNYTNSYNYNNSYYDYPHTEEIETYDTKLSRAKKINKLNNKSDCDEFEDLI